MDTMNRSRFPFRRPAASGWCLALMLGTAFAGAVNLALAQTGPVASSPGAPTPYDARTFHAGGALTPVPPATPQTAQQGQLQGTPTEIFPLVTGVPTQIPSFLLGNYDPATPPNVLAAPLVNHFFNGSYFSWSAPFNYVPTSASTVTVDDTSPAPTGGPPATTSGFAIAPTTGGFVNVPGTPGTPGDTPATTASGGEYDRLPPGTQTAPVNGTATWTLVATAAGSFSVYFHIPDDIADSQGNVEARSTAVQYQITQTTAAGTLVQSETAEASQTEANSLQYLAGPFQLAAGDVVTVTLNRNRAYADATGALPAPVVKTIQTLNQENYADYLIADSMTLQTAIGDVQSTPTAINYDAFPNDFKRAQYWGIYVPTGTLAVAAGATQTIGTSVAANALPDYGPNSNPPIGPPSPANSKPYLRLGNPNGVQPDTTTVDGEHRIRQLVYFGRTEPLVNYTVRVDDQDAAFSTTGTFQAVTYTTGPPVKNANASTATNGEYLTAGTAGGGIPSATATWTFKAPAQANYSLSVHLPQVGTGEVRIADATYHVKVNGTSLPDVTGFSQVPPGGGAADVTLPTAPLALAKGDVVLVTLDNTTATQASANVVVADSITLTTGNGQGAIYCVDGFTGGVVWRYQTPASPRNGPSAPVFSSPAVARINVLVSPGDPNATTPVPPTYDNRLVVIVGDNNGQVYCLDAIGNGDGTSNANVLNAEGQPINAVQPAYGTTPPGLATQPPFGTTAAPFDQTKPHVGTTDVYWTYRPDASLPKDLGTGSPRLDATGKTLLPLPDRDLPVPGSFGAASPTVYVDPSVPALAGPTPAATPVTATTSAQYHNATVYVGNSNGVLYALDATGVPYSTSNQATSIPYNKTTPASTPTPYGDTFNPVLDLRGGGTGAVVPTCQPQWWFSIRGESPNSPAAATSADIESAPAVYVTATPAAAPATGTTYTPTVYVGSSHEQESTSNVGFLYAVNGTYGPSGNGGKSDPRTTAGLPGTANYNVDPRPTLPASGGADTTDWTFPDKYGTQTTINASGKPRPGLGNLSGSPVVFTNFHETATAAHQTRIYFAANSGLEVPAGTTSPVAVAPTVRPDDTTTGRIWAVNLDGSVGTTTNGVGGRVWAYPLANDPNDASKDKTAEPFAPIGSFLHVTPAIGYVQFPATIGYGAGGATAYTHPDAFQADIKGKTVPMLYAATRGVNDASLYGVDIDGDMNPTQATNSPNYDQRTIYRVVSPDGAIFQSSPVLITNSTTAGGNGGAVFITGGDTLYDYGATPISNPDGTSTYPLVNQDKSFVGFGPLSGPAVAAATVYDTTLTTGNLTFTTPPTQNIVTDWVYVGDSSTGFCRGITPNDPADGDIPTDLGDIVPADVSPPQIVDLNAILRSYLVLETKSGSTAYSDALTAGPTAPLPVYDWGENAYIRFANVVPPNVGTLPGVLTNPSNPNPPDPTKFMHDQVQFPGALPASPANPIRVYWNPGTATNNLTFFLSDGVDGSSVDSATIPSVKPDGTANLYTTATTPLTVGFIARTDNDTTDNNLIDNNGKQYIAAYTYAIGDGTARKNTPGARRRVQDATLPVISLLYVGPDPTKISSYAPDTSASATVLRATTTSGNLVSTPTRDATGVITGYKDTPVKAAVQPTFGILNPIGLRGGGVPLPLSSNSSATAVEIGDTLGPFRGITSPMPLALTAPDYDAEALTNGNTVYTVSIPPSTTGGGDPTRLPLLSMDASTLPTADRVVVTSTGLIPHNGSGENSDTASVVAPPIGRSTATATTPDTSEGLYARVTGDPLTFGSLAQPFALDAFDRSALGTAAKFLKLKTGVTPDTGREGLYWNDNSTNVTGHDSVVNFLPWETAPTGYKVGTNASPDYPDIGAQHVALTLHADDNNSGSTASLASDGAVATPATQGTGDVLHRTVYASPIQVHIDVPHYQPANQQLYSKTAAGGGGYSALGEIVPQQISTGSDQVFPMGYVTTTRIYVPNQSGRYEPGCAYRDIRIYTGVPVSMSTSIADGTIDIGKVPSAFGIQTDGYAGYKDGNGNYGFTPYNTLFQNYFLPITVHNDGNVNLLNVHLDQKVANSPTTYVPLVMRSDPVDPLSVIPAYDVASETGPRVGSFNGVAELPFLIRSSVDTDLGAAYGRNPGITGNTTYAPLYPGVTFHKARPGDGTPTTLTVPDVPYDNSQQVAGATNPFYLPPVSLPVVNGGTAAPRVSVAIPFGTPIGAYRQMVRVFEGLDTSGYQTYNSSTNTGLNPYYPPQYGGAVGGQGTPSSPATDVLSVGVQPMSDPGVTVRATVLEDRMTDGFTVGAVPQIDAAPSTNAGNNAFGAPDFAPAAFRDPATGGIGIYWTSGRPVSGSSSAFNVQGAYVPFNVNSNAKPGNYFYPGNTSGNVTQGWWNPFTPTLQAGTNSGLSVAQDYSDPANVYAFTTDVVSTAPYQNTLYSYTVSPSTGGLSNPLPVTPPTDNGTVKYGIHGLYTKSGFSSGAPSGTPSLWAFWTSVTRGRTTISYNSFGSNGAWVPTSGGSTVGLLPVPAGLSSVADPSPVLMTAPVIVNGGGFAASAPFTQSVIEVTYSGVALDGNTDLYQCRYVPAKDSTTGVFSLALASYPTLTEYLSQADGGWYQARDVAWSRTGQLNLTVNGTPILYDPANNNKALFSRALFDKASGLLVLSGVSLTGASGGTVTVYADLATGRIRFAGGTPSGPITATFNPLARRLTVDDRADTAPVTFLDAAMKVNDAPSLAAVEADRRWYVWRKSGVTGVANSATLYYKTQRLAVFLPAAVDVTKTPTVTVGGSPYNGTVDVHNVPAQFYPDGTLKDPASAVLYFPILSGSTFLEGQAVTVQYVDQGGKKHDGSDFPQVADVIQWQDEERSNDSAAAPLNTAAGLARVNTDYAVPLDTPVNENNVSAFLDPDAYKNTSASVVYPHKVWLFWNSTRNGTADLYMETINPRF